MSRVLTQEEIDALRSGGPIVPAPQERVAIVIEAGRAEIPFEDLAKLTPGSLLPLDGAPRGRVEVVANGTTVAYGALVERNARLCVRIDAPARPGTTPRGRAR